MTKLETALTIAEIQVALLRLLHRITEDELYEREDAIEDIKELLREMNGVYYPFE
ncbi:hypothetical protein [Bacillus canaveralius]|uniref:hypothetical protein n=1 Tax=Bacillus canaveralius TaxID=1403243 RepID=UPI0015E15A97|nr:hypothetical protein [Bacillus canaveralius]